MMPTNEEFESLQWKIFKEYREYQREYDYMEKNHYINIVDGEYTIGWHSGLIDPSKIYFIKETAEYILEKLRDK